MYDWLIESYIDTGIEESKKKIQFTSIYAYCSLNYIIQSVVSFFPSWLAVFSKFRSRSELKTFYK